MSNNMFNNTDEKHMIHFMDFLVVFVIFFQICGSVFINKSSVGNKTAKLVIIREIMTID